MINPNISETGPPTYLYVPLGGNMKKCEINATNEIYNTIYEGLDRREDDHLSNDIKLVLIADPNTLRVMVKNIWYTFTVTKMEV